jgi:hypothetical protein
MKRTLMAAALLFSFTVAAAAQDTQHPVNNAAVLEAQERNLWQAFKNKDKATLSAMLDDGFHLFEEGLTAIGDKKVEVNAVDDFELVNYTLSDFTVKPIGPNVALVLEGKERFRRGMDSLGQRMERYVHARNLYEVKVFATCR